MNKKGIIGDSQFTIGRAITILAIIILGIFLISFVSALTISNTNFSNPDVNNSFSVNSVTLNKIVLNTTASEFYNVSSTNSDFIDDNDTYNATIYFIGLLIDLGVYDVNTSTYVFNSTNVSQDYKATIEPLQRIRILSLIQYWINTNPIYGTLSCFAYNYLKPPSWSNCTRE